MEKSKKEEKRLLKEPMEKMEFISLYGLSLYDELPYEWKDESGNVICF